MLTNPHYEDIFELCDIIRETSFDIHKYLRSGHLEKIYENALAHRLRKMGLEVCQQYPLQVFDEDGTELGKLKIDLIVDSQLVLEIKACRTVIDEHTAQLLGYLRACRFEHGMLINFGSGRLHIKKYILSQEHGQ